MDRKEILDIFLAAKKEKRARTKKNPYLSRKFLLDFIKNYKKFLLYPQEYLSDFKFIANRDDLDNFITERLSEIPTRTFETQYDNLTDNGLCKLPDDLQMYIIDKLRSQPIVGKIDPVKSLSLVNKHFYNLTKHLKMYYTRLFNMPIENFLEEMNRKPDLFLNAGPFLMQLLGKFFEGVSRLNPATMSGVYNRLHLYPVNFTIMRYQKVLHYNHPDGYKNLKDVFLGLYEIGKSKQKRLTPYYAYFSLNGVDLLQNQTRDKLFNDCSLIKDNNTGHIIMENFVSRTHVKAVERMNTILLATDNNYANEMRRFGQSYGYH
jgi:hypothetical protein